MCKNAILLPEERGCNRPPVLGTATLYGWRTIRGLRHILRAGTAWGIACYGLLLWGYRLLILDNLLITCRILSFFLVVSKKKRTFVAEI